ncbi:hypothetical protein DL98DRAFT_517454 [Cadophora sp. DSE1049]|nr:hypothetical protein DL98DRAFT_517454 [Cadophora sp. DSE1049]
MAPAVHATRPALADCNSFLRKTVTPAAVYVTQICVHLRECRLTSMIKHRHCYRNSSPELFGDHSPNRVCNTDRLFHRHRNCLPNNDCVRDCCLHPYYNYWDRDNHIAGVSDKHRQATTDLGPYRSPCLCFSLFWYREVLQCVLLYWCHCYDHYCGDTNFDRYSHCHVSAMKKVDCRTTERGTMLPGFIVMTIRWAARIPPAWTIRRASPHLTN